MAMKMLGFLKRQFLRLSISGRVSLIVLLVAIVYWLITYSPSDERIRPYAGLSDYDRVQQVNMNQAKLCILKIDAETSIYHRHHLNRLDAMPYEVWYRHSGEVDVIVDLSKSRFEQNGDRLIVHCPEPQIDQNTVNIRPANLELVGTEDRMLRTEWQKTEAHEVACKRIIEDLNDVVAQNFPKAEAIAQAKRMLLSLYRAVGCHNVEVVFYSENLDFK